MKTVVVTAAIIIRDSQCLIARRKPEAHQGLKWELPGGKLEVGESPEDCLRREICEELNLVIEVGDIYKIVSHNYENTHVILLCYKCSIIAGTPKAIDCHDFCWVYPEDMENFEFAPADVPVVLQIREQGL